MSILVSINKDQLLAKLQLADLTVEQQETVWQLILDIFQTRIIERILSYLSNETDKRQFLVLLTSDDEQKLRDFLTARIEDVDTKIESLIVQITTDLKQDVITAREEGQ